MVDFFANGVQLATAVASDDDEIVEHGCDFAHVEQHDVPTTIVVCCPRGGECEL